MTLPTPACPSHCAELDGLDVHAQTPTKILHTLLILLLGQVEYLWRAVVVEIGVDKLQVDLKALNAGALSTRPSTLHLLAQPGALIGKVFKFIIQVAPVALARSSRPAEWPTATAPPTLSFGSSSRSPGEYPRLVHGLSDRRVAAHLLPPHAASGAAAGGRAASHSPVGAFVPLLSLALRGPAFVLMPGPSITSPSQRLLASVNTQHDCEGGRCTIDLTGAPVVQKRNASSARSDPALSTTACTTCNSEYGQRAPLRRCSTSSLVRRKTCRPSPTSAARLGRVQQRGRPQRRRL